MRLSPAAAGVEVTGTVIVGLLLSGPVGSVAAATPGGWLRTGRIGAAPGAPGDLTGLPDAACPTPSCPSCGGERVTRSPAGSGRAERCFKCSR
jgi:hypothetical protein